MLDEEEDEDELTYSPLDIQKLLQCSICLDRFKQPKLLPCQHTFCENPCLEGLVRGFARSIKCPECRAEHRLPYNGVSGFPNNLTIKSFLDLRRKRNRNDSGGERGAGAASGDCSQVNEPVPSTAAASRSGCGNCGRETFLAKCGHCEQVLCEPCTTSHIEQVRNDVLRLVSQIRRGIPQMSNALHAVEEKSEQLKDRSEVAKNDVTEVIERFIMELRGRQNLLHNEIDMFHLGEKRSLTVYKENLEVEMTSISSFCDTAETKLSQPSVEVSSDQIMQLKRQCVQNMEKIRSYESGNFNLPRERTLSFLMEETRLSNAISAFGEMSTADSNETSTTQSTPPQNLSRQNSFQNPSLDGSEESTPENSISRLQSDFVSRPSSYNDVTASDSHDVDRRQLSSTSFAHTPSSPRQERTWNYDYGFHRRSLPSANESTSEVSAPRRSLQDRRRQHYSDSRIAALIGGRVLLREDQHSPQTRRRHTDFSSTIHEEPYHSDSGLNLSRSRTYSPGDNYADDDAGPSTEVEPITRYRPSVRFDISPSDDEESDSSNEDVLRQVANFEENENSRVTSAINNYQNKGRAIVTFGRRGNDNMQFTWPRGVAITSDNSILIADSSNHRVQVFDRGGLFLKSFGSYGQNEGEFDCLAGISVNTFGQIVIVDRYNHRIQVFDHHGNFRLTFGEEGCDHGQLLYPWGVATDNMGFIYVCDKENHRVQVFQSSGRFVRAFGTQGQGPGEFDSPHYLSISPDNKVYVSDSNNHRIQVFSIYGDYLFSFGSAGSMQGQLRYPKGITVDDHGFVIVGDSGNNRIQIFHSDGRYICMFGSYGSENGQFKGLEGVAILSNGKIVVCDRENHRIQIF